MDRRKFLKAGVAGAGGLLWLPAAGCVPDWQPPANGTVFTLGVMSGLHSPSEVVLWTRVEPLLAPGAGTLRWSVAADPAMTAIVSSGTVAVGAAADHTAKVLVGGLPADRSFWFRFEVDGAPDLASPVGRARTLPTPTASPAGLRLAFASCQQWTAGWYNAWAGIAEEDLDAVLWLGDYIYESGSTTATPLDVRPNLSGRAETLSSYRARYRQYRSDPLLQRAHAAHPTVAVWDDHEFVNNWNRETLIANPRRGAEAMQAWFEYMPVWPIDGTRIYRSLRWGRLADLLLIDTRQYRDRQPNGFAGSEVEVLLGIGPVVAEAAQPGRTILGEAQRGWLLDRLDAAQSDGVAWKLIGNQVMVAPTRIFDWDEEFLRLLDANIPKHNGLYINVDSWDGYLWERDLVLQHLVEHSIADVAFLTGDVHSFWQAGVRADFDSPGSPVIAQEFVSGSISSSGPGIIGNDDLLRSLEQAVMAFNPGFRYVDYRRNGYGVAEITPASMVVTFRTTRVRQPGEPTGTSVSFEVLRGADEALVTAVAP